MKIHEILTEAIARSPEEIAQTIRRDCAPFLSMIGNEPLRYRIYRGTYKKIPFFSKQRCPKNRRPRDTDPKVSKIADKWFLENRGVRFRSAATFGSGDLDVVEDNYGPPFVVLPIGEFDFCWSPNVGDMTYDLFDVHGLDGHNSQDVIDLLEGADYIVNENLALAINSCHEIMLYCPNGFYMLYHESNDEADYYGYDFRILQLVQNPTPEKADHTYEKKKLTAEIKAAMTKLRHQQDNISNISEMISAFKHALTLPLEQRQESLIAAGHPVDTDQLDDAGLNRLIKYWQKGITGSNAVIAKLNAKYHALNAELKALSGSQK